jgi:hypothetical protein
LKAAGASTAGLWLKGVGHLTQSLSAVGAGGEVTNALQFALGSMTNRSAFNALVAADMCAFLLFRNDDTSLMNGVSNAGKVSSSSATSATATPRGPSPARRRAASGRCSRWSRRSRRTRSIATRHTGTHSSVFNTGADTTTGIVGGDIDSISVGVTLNQNGVVYNCFVIPGDVVAGNAGFSVAGTFMPVSPNPPPGAMGDPLAPQEPPDAPVADPSTPVTARCRSIRSRRPGRCRG